MYAQVVHGGAAPENREQMDSIVVDELLPALEQEPGYAGAVNLVDRETGHAMMIVLWDTEDQEERIGLTLMLLEERPDRFWP